MQFQLAMGSHHSAPTMK
uniref:Uncharacterized protein n=1 Tax=Anguilla anguilla TaxID=7936 RepID=A0A0E9VX58_ANGAN